MTAARRPAGAGLPAPGGSGVLEEIAGRIQAIRNTEPRTPAFLNFARTRQHASPGTEPRLAIALGAYAREHPVTAIPVPGDVIDLGTPEVTVPGQAPHESEVPG